MVAGVLAVVVSLPALASAHPERTTTFPDLDQGSVPKVRHGGKAIFVCNKGSKARIKRIYKDKRKRERLRMRQLRRCDHRTIQSAVEDAKSGYRIRILPGKYKEKPSRRVAVGSFGNPPCADDYVETEGFSNSAPPPVGPRSNDPPVRPNRNYQVNCPTSKNLIEVVGDPRPEPDPDNPIKPVCLQLCNLQIEGLGRKPTQVKIIGDRKKLDVLRIDRADGIVIRNLLVEQSAFNGIDIVETSGFLIQDVVSRYNQDYGVLSFTAGHGLYNRVTAYGNGDSGVYPGSNQKGCVAVGDYPIPGDGTCGSDPGSRDSCGELTTEIKNSNSYGNVLGYSGTAGNSTYLHDNKFHDNSAGLSTDSFAAGHPGMPQECVRWENNEIYSNNDNNFTTERQQYCSRTPFVDRQRKIVCPQFQVPVGTGILMAGANRNLIQNNKIWDNWRYGIFLLTVEAAIRGDQDPTHQTDTSNGNRILANTMGVDPSGNSDPNGSDLIWDGGGQGNCFAGNSGPGGAAATVAPQVIGFDQIGACPGSPAYLPAQPAVQGAQVPCAAWDPNVESLQNPPGCDWFMTPPEPQPKG